MESPKLISCLICGTTCRGVHADLIHAARLTVAGLRRDWTRTQRARYVASLLYSIRLRGLTTDRLLEALSNPSGGFATASTALDKKTVQEIQALLDHPDAILAKAGEQLLALIKLRTKDTP